MTTAEALALPRPAADLRSAYGEDPNQFGELRLPEGPGPHPVAIVLHGGCWLAEYDLGYMASLSAALAEVGVATWSLEYRRVGDLGGGWPGTFADVGAGADHLRELASHHPLDLQRVIAVGHSAGGHLALWLAARHRLLATDPLRGESPLPLVGVLSLAGIPDLAAYSAPDGCGAAVRELLGGEPNRVHERLMRASPIELVPFGTPQVLLTGAADQVVAPVHAHRFAVAAGSRGDPVKAVEIANAGHFELVAPETSAWPAVISAVLELLRVPGADAGSL
jgi:acetyl esterase/lipase